MFIFLMMLWWCEDDKMHFFVVNIFFRVQFEQLRTVESQEIRKRETFPFFFSFTSSKIWGRILFFSKRFNFERYRMGKWLAEESVIQLRHIKIQIFHSDFISKIFYEHLWLTSTFCFAVCGAELKEDLLYDVKLWRGAMRIEWTKEKDNRAKHYPKSSCSSCGKFSSNLNFPLLPLYSSFFFYFKCLQSTKSISHTLVLRCRCHSCFFFGRPSWNSKGIFQGKNEKNRNVLLVTLLHAHKKSSQWRLSTDFSLPSWLSFSRSFRFSCRR